MIIPTLLHAGVPFKDRGINVGKDFVNVCCPFCSEQRFHCGIHLTEPWFKCFVCGKSGHRNQVARMLGVVFDDGNIFLPTVEEVEKPPEQKTRLPPSEHLHAQQHEGILQWLTTKPHPQDKRDLRPRGITVDMALRFCRVGKRSKDFTNSAFGYIVFEENNSCVCRRYIDKPWAKWLKFGNRTLPFGVEQAAQNNSEHLVLTEGVFDILHLPVGVGIALLTNNLTNAALAHILTNLPQSKKITMVLDADVPTDNIRKASMKLRDCGFEVTVFDWRRYGGIKDLDDLCLHLGAEKVWQLLQVEVAQDVALL